MLIFIAPYYVSLAQFGLATFDRDAGEIRNLTVLLNFSQGPQRIVYLKRKMK